MSDGVGIERFVLGPYQTNCYLIVSEGESGPRAWVADVGFGPGPMLDRVAALGVEPEAFVLTHAHLDHIAGLNEARARFPGVPVWIHEAEERWLLDAELNLSAVSGAPVTGPPADRLLRDGETLSLGGRPWSVLHTPGHSPGGVSLYDASAGEHGVVLCGDALFAGSVGRTDFPGSDADELARSIREKLYTLPPETDALPGHGPPTTIGRERLSNPFVRG